MRATCLRATHRQALLQKQVDGIYSALFRKNSVEQVIASGQGAWQSRGCRVYFEHSVHVYYLSELFKEINLPAIREG